MQTLIRNDFGVQQYLAKAYFKPFLATQYFKETVFYNIHNINK